jgi:predicted ArsR family transcriptional regulator
MNQPAFNFDRYPHRVGHKRTDTSASAARSVEASAPRLRQLCLDMLRISGPLTADECASNMGRDKLSIRPRFSELREMGKVVDTGERRRNRSGKSAIVWTVP